MSAGNMVLDPQRTIVVVVGPAGSGMQTWNYKTNAKLVDFATFPAGGNVMDLDPKTGVLILGGSGGIRDGQMKNGRIEGGLRNDLNTLVRAYDPMTGKLLKEYSGTRTSISSVSVSPDGRYIAAMEGGPLPGVDLLVWQAETGELLERIDYGVPSQEGQTSFSPDGRYLAAIIDHDAHIYEINK
jgi:WD40 repeat protein